MPAYSFKEQFIPFLLDGSKEHTVRNNRVQINGRSRHALPGDTVFLYYGMRTKFCRKIGEATCRATQDICITEQGIYFPLGPGSFRTYFPEECDAFAWKDGFRPEGATMGNPSGAFDLMLQFFKQTHDLPFQGVVIYWKDFKAAQ